MNKITLLIFVLLSVVSKAQTWSMVGKGIQSQYKDGFNTIYALEIYKDELYAAGSFTIAGGVIANRIAKWDGNNWSEVGTGTNGLVFTLKVYKDELYAAGWFTAAGGERANYIAKWNGSVWSSVGGGMDFHPNCLEVYKDELYVAGEFTKAGGKPARNIAKWNGTTWSTLGKGQDVSKWIGAYKGILFTGGYAFNTKNNFFQWNGTDWLRKSYDLEGLPSSMTVYKDEFYVGGYFPKHGKIDEMSITKFDGKIWSKVGKEGTNGHVYSMLVLGDELFCGGFFSAVDGIPTNNLAKWNGTVWSSFTPGLNYHAHAFVVYKNEIFAAGGYERAESGIIGKEMIMKMPLADFKAISK